MSLQRMKFAYARGARIQFLYFTEWEACQTPLWGQIKDKDFRIHPDDKHLEYGPMSTACLELAQHEFAWKGDHPDALGDPSLTPMQWAAREYAIVLAEDLDSGQQRAAVFGDHGGWQLWCGIVAEYLADQGM